MTRIIITFNNNNNKYKLGRVIPGYELNNQDLIKLIVNIDVIKIKWITR